MGSSEAILHVPSRTAFSIQFISPRASLWSPEEVYVGFPFTLVKEVFLGLGIFYTPHRVFKEDVIEKKNKIFF